MSKELLNQSFDHLFQGRDWKILLLDEEEHVHTEVYSSLRSFSYHGKGIELISATNYEITQILLEQHPDVAIVLLGKIKNPHQELVNFVRQETHNNWTRIIICTGAIEDEGLQQLVQGHMQHSALTGPSLRSHILHALKSYEEFVYSITMRNHVPQAVESFGKGAVTIIRWKDKVEWSLEFVSLNINELLGYSDDTLLSGEFSISRAVFPADVERVTRENQDCKEQGLRNYTQQYRMVTKDGRVIWVYDYTTILYDDDGVATNYISYIHDVTEKQEQERLLFDREIFGVLTLDVESQISEINLSAADTFRVTQEAMIGSPLLDWVEVSSKKAVASYLKQAREHGKPQRFESNIKRPDGSLTPCQFTLAGSTETDSISSPVTVIIEDLTEKVRVEDDLRNSLAAEKSFIASVSHEIRTPLASILGYTELMRSTSGLTDEQRQFIENIDINSNHLLNLINDILDISKIESNQLSINPQEVVFSDIFAACGVVVSSKMNEGVKLNVNIPDVDFYVKADPVRIKQIFINLLSNAAKFTTEGAVYLYLKDMMPLENDLISLRICVEDTGIGISGEKQKELFKPFKQAHIGEYGGTGLGLYLSKSIAKLMDGDITVKSELGKGSQFIVELVLAKGRQKETDLHFEGINILVVGDYPSLSDHQKSKLLETGVNLMFVDALERGRALVEKCLEFQDLDVAIIDVDILRERAAYVAGMLKDCLPKLVVLGIKTKSIGIESQDFDQFLLKPFSFFQLGNSIKKLLLHEQAPDELDLSNLKILMAEDAEANRLLYKQLFQKFFQIELELAENGEEAVEKLRNHKYDLVLMDLQMPILDGIAATKQIRKFDIKTKIYALTGSVYAEVLRKCTKAGMNGHLAKPVLKEELHELLTSCLTGEPMKVATQKKKSKEEKTKLIQTVVSEVKREEKPMTNYIRKYLESMGSPTEVVAEILNSAVTEITECYNGVISNLQNGDLDKMRSHLHKLKGLLMNFDLSKESEMVKDVEVLVKEAADETLIKKKISTFLESFKEFR